MSTPAGPKNALVPEGWVQIEAHASFAIPLGFETQRIADAMGDLLGSVGDGPAFCLSSGCESACRVCGCTRTRRCRPECDPTGRRIDLCDSCDPPAGERRAER